MSGSRKRVADELLDEHSDRSVSPPRKRVDTAIPTSTVSRGTRNGYLYQDLPGSRFIRILVLQPSSDSADRLVGSLLTLDLDKCTEKYSAVSYSWATEDGNAALEREITIDGYQVRITLNLFRGLSRIRHRQQNENLWVDALCINQQDLAERGRQVTMMPDIYRHAERTVVWFGEGSSPETNKMVYGIFKRLSHCSAKEFGDEHVRAVSHSSTTDWCIGERPSEHGSCTLLGHSQQLYDIDAMKLNDSIASHPRALQDCAAGVVAIGEFCARRYWKRLWIVQELLLSTQQLWYWGDCVIDPALLTWSHLDILHETVFRLYGALAKVLDSEAQPAWRHHDINAVAQIFRMKSERQRPPLKSKIDARFLDALGETGSMQCADPRDRVYALLGLADHPPLAPDYTKSTIDVYIDFAAMLIRSGMGYMIIEQFTHPFSGPTKDATAGGLPSWVPDLRRGFRLDYRYTFEQFFFDAWLDTSDKMTLTCRIFPLGVIGNDITFSPEPAEPGSTNLRLHGGIHRHTTDLIKIRIVGDELAKNGDHIFASSRVLRTQGKSPSVRRAAAMVMILRPTEASLSIQEGARYRIIQTDTLSLAPRDELNSLEDIDGIIVNLV